MTDLPPPQPAPAPWEPEPDRPGRGRSGPVNSRLAAAAVAAAVAAVATGFSAPWQAALLVPWVAGASTWAGWTWVVVLRLDPVSASRLATSEEPNREQTYVLLLTAAVASLVAVVLGVTKAGHTTGGERVLLLSSSIAAIVVSWLVVHTVFTLRYAALYYLGPDGGIDFNEEIAPVYADFAYLAFTVGMTFQVSDTPITAQSIRHAALRHALLSYLFGTVIIAATVNLASGLAH